ncbi:MAG: NAD(P)/FAD-dependent oxidoreductase [Thiolinea sp.]
MSKKFLYSNDRPGQYPQSWYAATANTLPRFPELSGREQADVCIIGAGFTGLSAALHLAKSGYKVVVLEAHRAGWGASGRNGGQVGTGQRQDQDELEKQYGQEAARAMWDLSLDAVALCKSLIAEHQIDCDLQAGIIHADHRKRFVPETRAYVEKLQQDYQHEQIRFLDQDEIRQQVGSEAYFGGSLDMAAAHIHPLNYALGLAKAASEAGAIIYENSPVQEYSKASPSIIKTAQGSISAKHVILACNGYLDGLEERLANRIMPINNFIVATRPMSDAEQQHIIRHNHAVADSKFVVNYFRFSADNRLLFGGGENYSFNFPKDIKNFVKPHMLKIFPQLTDMELEYGWGGTLAITMSRMPCFTRITPTILSASGYSGHGVAMATLAGKLMAEVVDGTAARFDVMSQIKTYPFPGGTLLRWPLLALAMTWYSLRDRL